MFMNLSRAKDILGWRWCTLAVVIVKPLFADFTFAIFPLETVWKWAEAVLKVIAVVALGAFWWFDCVATIDRAYCALQGKWGEAVSACSFLVSNTPLLDFITSHFSGDEESAFARLATEIIVFLAMLDLTLPVIWFEGIKASNTSSIFFSLAAQNFIFQAKITD